MSGRRLLLALGIGLLLAAPDAARACAVCFSGSDDTRAAFTITTVFMSALPLTMIGSIVGWLLWRVRRLHAETTAPESVRLPGERDL